ncbi:efflux RND transporter permease subunit [Vibrio quintilis]|uniref:Multidrug resistance protein MdtC n=1 Tax=Vibrio quintilis TaxID=1117707 RepID=A0A1M7YRM9_9VIBR|nr:efflux RND transporter permease subunit [Vibrio quintilis]SHO55274.1 Multidrug resistance protein MdtC [Vibrio quintilis]
MKGLTRWFIENPVAANLLMVAVIVSGILSFYQLRVESFPQIAPSGLTIEVVYPGGTAKQIDQAVTQRIEEAISDIAGIKRIVSQSKEGISTVHVRKTTGTDLNQLIEEVRNRVNSMVNLPAAAERPLVSRDEFTNLAAFVVVSGPESDMELQPIARRIEQALKKNPKISKVENWGQRQPLLVIEPDTEKLRETGLSPEALAGKIQQMSLESRSGFLKSSRGKMILRGDGYAGDLVKLKQLVVWSSPKGQLTLGDVASVRRDYADTDAIVRNNGQNAIALLVSTSLRDNLLEVSQAIRQTLALEQRRLPDEIQLSVMADMAPYIKDQLNRLGSNALQGLLIVLVLLGLFLNLKMAFWVGIGIPFALCGTLGAMHLMDYSINDITLFGFILVLGILVDDAVVVGEGIYAARERYSHPAKAALHGVHSVSVATIFGVLTSVAAFSPMLWIKNDLARLLAGFSSVVIFALLFSLVESKFILPSHLGNESRRLPEIKWLASLQRYFQTGLARFNQGFYRKCLIKSLKYPFATLTGLLGLAMLAYGLWATNMIRSGVFPEIPGRYISAKVSLQVGAPLPLQQKVMMHLEQTALNLNKTLQAKYTLEEKPITNLLAWSDGEGHVEVTAELTREALTTIPGNGILDQWRSGSGLIEGAYSVRFSAADEPAGGTSVAVISQDRALARQAVHDLIPVLSVLPGVSDIYDDGKGGLFQIRLKLNESGYQAGITQADLARLAGEAFGQKELYRLLDHGQEIKVVMHYPQNKKLNTEQLLRSPVILPDGQSVALGDIATLSYEQEPKTIERRHREQVVNVYWKQNRDIQSPERTIQQLSETIKQIEQRYPGVSIQASGEFEEIGEVQSGFRAALTITVLLIYILLAVPLKSYWQPLLIMSVIPFGFAGSIFGHYLMDMQISVLSMFGMMAMAGIVVNDSLVLMTRFNDYYRAGMPLARALIQTGTSRFRAVFLTTVTTVCGLLPLLGERAEQAQYLKPAAVSLVFGELFATGVTLILIPVLLAMITPENKVVRS